MSRDKTKVGCSGVEGASNPGDRLLSQRFDQAFLWASQLHAEQRRKMNNTPYVAHLMSVAALVLEDGGSEEEAIAALLHDAVEDQGGLPTRSKILAQFGPAITAIVDGCTEPIPLPGEPWRSHKQRYFDQIYHSSPLVHRVVLADKLHNGRSLLVNLRQHGPDVWRQFRGSREDILWFHQQVLQLFYPLKPGWMVDELSRIVETIEHG